MKMSVDRVIRAGFGLALLILGAIAALAYRSVEDLIDHANQVARTLEVIRTVDDLEIAVLVSCNQRFFTTARRWPWLQPKAWPVVRSFQEGLHCKVIYDTGH